MKSAAVDLLFRSFSIPSGVGKREGRKKEESEDEIHWFRGGRMYHSTSREFLAKICTARNFYCFSVSITIPWRTRRRRSRVSERRCRDATLLPRENTRIQLRGIRRTDTTIFYRDTDCRCLPANNRSFAEAFGHFYETLGNVTVAVIETVLVKFFKSVCKIFAGI